MARSLPSLPPVSVPYGEPLYVALADMIRRAKRGDPLAPVTVAVPTNYAALHARRWLAGHGERGVANVRTLSVMRLAELLGGPTLADHHQRPLDASTLRAAIRASLREAPGPFATVANAPATVDALAPAVQELWAMGPEVLERLGQVRPEWWEWVADLSARLRPFYSGGAMWRAAELSVREGNSALADLGPVILWAPRQPIGPEAGLLAALADRVGLGVILGETGDEAHDRPRRESLAGLVGSWPRATAAPNNASSRAPEGRGQPSIWWEMPEPEDEVREAAAWVLEAAEQGVGWHRLAVLSVSSEPYASLARERLRGVGLPMTGRPRRTLAESHAGRLVSGLLALESADWSWRAVRDWMTSFPLRWEGELAPTEAWMRLAWRAGVVKGDQDWGPRLTAYAQRQDAMTRREADADPDDGDRMSAAAVVRRIQGVRRSVQEDWVRFPEDWQGFRDWCEALIEKWLGKVGRMEPDQRSAAEDLLALLRQITSLVGVDPRPTRDALRAALDDALKAPWRGDDRYGEGVFVGRLEDAVGLEFDRVVVVGLVEGVAPPNPADDPILDPGLRERLGLPVAPCGQRGHEADFAWRAVLASATCVVASSPRVSPRDGREAVASRWWQESLSDAEAAGRQPTLVRRASVVASLESRIPASVDEWDVAAGLRCGASALRPDGGVPGNVARAIQSSRSAWAPVFTPREGRLEGFDARRWDDRVWSVTMLDDLMACPRRFYYAGLLRLPMESGRDRGYEVSALDRGLLIHAALARFSADCRAESWAGDEAVALGRLQEIWNGVAEQAQRDGLTGSPALWVFERERLFTSLRRVASLMAENARSGGRHPVGEEVRFGTRNDPVKLPIREGSWRARGSIDRVEQNPDGDWFLLDFKTGKVPAHSVQLMLYEAAWRQQHPGKQVSSEYWAVLRDPVDRKTGVIPSSMEQLERHSVAVRRGLMVPFPDKHQKNCTFCAFTTICPRSRAQEWNRKAGDPAVADLAAPVLTDEGEETE